MGRQRQVVNAVLGWLCLALAGASPAAQWQTLEGLAISLSDRTGQPQRCQVGARSLRLSPGAAGGLSFREFLRDPQQPQRVIFRLGAEGEEQPWTQATFADWEASGDYVHRRTGNAAEGDAYLALGNGQDAGVGMAAAQTLPVPPGGSVSSPGRAAPASSNWRISCVCGFMTSGAGISPPRPRRPPAGAGALIHKPTTASTCATPGRIPGRRLPAIMPCMRKPQRIYAYRRPVSNLLQWKSAVLKRVPAMTPAELETYFANQLLYGFWPGISTAGGGTEPGYAHMHRYFHDPVLLNRDRPLFQKYLPVFFALNEAGWEPITYARSGQPEVRVERYGRGQSALLVVANTTDDDRVATLTWEAEGWQPGGRPLQPLSFRCLLTAASGRAEPVGGKLVCRLPVPARRTLVLQPANQGQVETK